WVNELAAPELGGFQGMNGLYWDEQTQTHRIDNLDYLAELVTQIIYTAGPKHAAVNYPQFPLGSYAPSVAASIYHQPPTASDSVTSPKDCLDWYLPLDVALYAVSFEYLLSGVQYDRFGFYDTDASLPYFDREDVQDLLAEFQSELANIEREVRARNRVRPMPYPFQLPSKIPNSISI
ncbi:MAG TPA: lipoxygenase family protein, partial [Polyangiales bacterium]|nr:lipoxygenase family protein [Polyangiales bacterium]